MAELVLEGLRVPGLLQAGYGAGVPQNVDRADMLRLDDPSVLKSLLHDLVDPSPADGEERPVRQKLDPVGVALQICHQGSTKGHLGGFVAFAGHRGHPAAGAGPGQVPGP